MHFWPCLLHSQISFASRLVQAFTIRSTYRSNIPAHARVKGGCWGNIEPALRHAYRPEKVPQNQKKPDMKMVWGGMQLPQNVSSL